MRNVVLILLTALFCWFVMRAVQETAGDKMMRLGFQPEAYANKSVFEWPGVGPIAKGMDDFFKNGPSVFDDSPQRRVRPRAVTTQESWGGTVVLPKINKTLYLAVAPDVDRAVVEQIARALREAYAIDVKLIDTPYIVPVDLSARQLDADRLLDRAWPIYNGILGQPATFGLLIVIGQDMRCKGLNFVFGTADIPKRYGIISTARFAMGHPSRELLMARVVKQAFSTVGFIAGIGRCPTPDCARAYPNSVSEHDRKSSKICNICLRRLAQVYEAINRNQ
jgi:predicted Zn-dependent protease